MDANKQDLGSVLAHVESLQKQLAAKEAEVKESRMREVRGVGFVRYLFY